MIVQLLVPGEPLPLERARVGKGRHYLPARSREYRERVQAAWMIAGRPCLGDVPLTCSARFYIGGREGDLDNYVKALNDCLSGFAYTDDRQIVCLSGCHRLRADAQGPRTELDLWGAQRFEGLVA
jgi:Holliday junction resolvase RusA-like endonuclease